LRELPRLAERASVHQAIVDGNMEWGIDAQQYAMGYIPVAMFDLWKKYKIMPIADYPTGPGFVTKDTAASVIDLISPLPAKVDPRVMIGGVIGSAVLGAGFGLWPALTAALLQPIEALRYE